MYLKIVHISIVFFVFLSFAFACDDCELPKCCKNEVAVQCKKPCPPDTCDSKYIKYNCENIRCLPGCICIKGYLRLNGTCIPEEKCPPPIVCCENEEYNSCGVSCPEPSCDNPKPEVCNKKCKAGCFCKKGYVRDDDNKCIPIEQCPKCDCNSHYSKCPDPCPATCYHTLPLPCKKACAPGCQCDGGYVLSEIGGKCVKIDECKDYAKCSCNETWVSCNPRCPYEYCPTNDKPQPVCDPPNPCPGGCGCKNNYKRNSTDECILASDCPPVECSGQNEVWCSCSSPYLKEDCASRNVKKHDADDSNKCIPRCICKKGYYRNDKYVCVPECDCPE